MNKLALPLKRPSKTQCLLINTCGILPILDYCFCTNRPARVQALEMPNHPKILDLNWVPCCTQNREWTYCELLLTSLREKTRPIDHSAQNSGQWTAMTNVIHGNTFVVVVLWSMAFVLTATSIIILLSVWNTPDWCLSLPHHLQVLYTYPRMLCVLIGLMQFSMHIATFVCTDAMSPTGALNL